MERAQLWEFPFPTNSSRTPRTGSIPLLPAVIPEALQTQELPLPLQPTGLGCRLGSIKLCHSLWSLLMFFWINSPVFCRRISHTQKKKKKNHNPKPQTQHRQHQLPHPCCHHGIPFPGGVWKLWIGGLGSAGSAPARELQLCQASRDSSQPRAPTSRSQAPTHSAHSWHSRHRGAPHLPERELGRCQRGDLWIPGTDPRLGWRGRSGSAPVTQQTCHRGQLVTSPSVPVVLLVRCHTCLESGWV